MVKEREGRGLVVAAGCALVAGLLVGAGPAGTRPAATGTAPAAASAPAADYPKAVQKKLYAEDFRGKKAPDLVAEKWLTAKPEMKGKVVIIDFWATWCPPCREAIPELNELQKKFKEDVVVIGISDESAEKILEFKKGTPMEYTLAVDTKGVTKKKVGVSGIPHVLILSTDQVVRWQGFPFSSEEPLTAEIVQKIVEADPGVAARRAADKAKKGS